MANFFIDRPIFAWVIAIIMMMAGALSIMTLPIEQYPDIAPPSVSVNATYTGADAQTVENTVTQIIEQNLTGLDNLMYMSSTSNSMGGVTVTLTFEPGTDPDVAQVQVLNKVEQAKARLPEAVQTNGISVTKSNSSFLKVLGFYSEDGTMTQDDIADYLVTNLQDPISRAPGVGNVQVFGGQYAMRIWLDPNKMVNYSLTVTEIVSALKAQNAQVTAGQLGGAPSVPGQELNATITAQTRLSTPEQFGNILVKVNTDGSQIRLKDIARIELGASSYGFISRFNGKESAGIGIYLATGANQLDTAKAVDAKMEELKPYFPEGLVVVEPFDTTPFVKLSIGSVVQTLIEAIVLVVCVMYLFLQNFRATLIPTITVPVVLLGTFAILGICGFSINTLTMFAMVLAIGLLVDDSIVVVENVERIMAEEGLPPREATRKSMGQITGALVGIALVLSAVFIPMAFFGGATGGIYRQFSITIISAMGLSVVIAIILTPALCATILKPIKAGHAQKTTGFFGWFNRVFKASTEKYENGVVQVLQKTGRYFIIYGLLIAAMVLVMLRIPSGFLPNEDQGVAITMVELKAGSTQEETQAVLDKVANYFLNNDPNVEEVFSVAGFSMAGQGQNVGLAFIKLKDWSERKDLQNKVDAITGRANGYFFQNVEEANIYTVNLPAIPALGMSNGFSYVLQDIGGVGHDALMAARNQMLGMASQNSSLAQVRPNGMSDNPQFNINVDFEKAQTLGVSITDINTTLATAWGSAYVDDFIDRTRVKRVYVQADAPYRMLPKDLNYWYVKNNKGEMVPFSAFATTSWSYGSPRLERYNGNSSVEIAGSAAMGVSSGQAMEIMDELSKQLPDGLTHDWTGISYQERLSGNQAPALYALSVIIVFLCLAALYESWSVPFSVLLVVPLGILGAVLATWARGLENDIYFKVGLLTTIGLSAKNAILIVEFAKDLIEKEGKGLIEATIESCRMRLRPILMTSLAFIFGVLPLAISNGAGSASQNAVGTGVIGGMLTATFLAIYLVPLFFVAVRRLFNRPTQTNYQAHDTVVDKS
jgi:multidrug efflux pump